VIPISSATLVYVLRVLSLLGSALTAYKLYRTGLHRRYPVFFSYFLFRVPYGASLFLDVRSAGYAWFWIITAPITWLFYVWMVVELSRLILAHYKGLYTVFRWAMLASVVIAASISALSLIPRIRPDSAQRSKYLGLILAGERGLDLSLAIFILLILLFLSRYPVTLSRNVRVHVVVYSLYFLASTSGFLLRSLFGLKLADETDLLIMLASTGAMCAWLLLLSPEGETIPVAENRISTEHEQHLLAQLDSLNALVLKNRG
jgi:hypothetical protein